MHNIRDELKSFIAEHTDSANLTATDKEVLRVSQYLLKNIKLEAIDSLACGENFNFLDELKDCVNQAMKLYLHQEVSVSVLQLGGSHALFALVCKAYGHEAFSILSTNYDGRSQEVLDAHLSLSEILGVSSQVHGFAPGETLPSFGRKFDIIAGYNLDANLELSWDAPAWDAFIADLFSNQRGVNGRLYIETDADLQNATGAFDPAPYLRVVESNDKSLTQENVALRFGTFTAPVRSTTQKANPLEDTREQLLTFIEANKEARKGVMPELVSLCEYALQTINFDEYEQRKAFHFGDDSPTRPNKRKYFDLLYYLKAKLRVAMNLGLHKESGLNVLDIGTGVGHFPFICKCYGHSVVCTDIPDNTTEGGFKSAEVLAEYTNFPEDRRSIYKDVLSLLGVERIDHRIEAFTPLPDFGMKFDRISALMISFDKYFVEQTLWGFDEWDCLLKDIKNNQLNPDGKIYFQMNRSAHYKGMHFDAPEFIKFFEEHGMKVNVDKSLVTYNY